jgi:hypothetical protein
MGHCGIDCNDQIEVCQHCRGVSKIAQCTAHIVEDHPGWWLVELRCCAAGLQTEQRQVWELRERRQGCQWTGAIPVILV